MVTDSEIEYVRETYSLEWVIYISSIHYFLTQLFLSPLEIGFHLYDFQQTLLWKITMIFPQAQWLYLVLFIWHFSYFSKLCMSVLFWLHWPFFLFYPFLAAKYEHYLQIST
jgi:hypothetical protein